MLSATPTPFSTDQLSSHGHAHGHLLPMQNRPNGPEEMKIWGLVMDLARADTRETALLELSKKREQYDDLALVLWHSFGLYFNLRELVPSWN